eukprot:GCRY01000993.1.p1 GENE.GCRY01000993.1~~GCRY01000993.1.p1  ORF type:complete len:180 (+),score=9.67 GCRY01000993.1:290-829(+)
MGLVFSSLWRKLVFGKQESKIVIVGLHNAGKTTILYKYLLNEVVSTVPTIGSNVEEIVYNKVKFLMWDLGGQDSLRPSWSTYYTDTQALILVIDSSEPETLPLAKKELEKILINDDLKDSALLIFANKQDVKGALSAEAISNQLNLHAIKGFDWHIQGCCALNGQGLYEGLDWIVDRRS